jgi:hypothetical protein
MKEIGIGGAPHIYVVETRVLIDGETIKYINPTGCTYQTPVRENKGQVAHPGVNGKDLHY